MTELLAFLVEKLGVLAQSELLANLLGENLMENTFYALVTFGVVATACYVVIHVFGPRPQEEVTEFSKPATVGPHAGVCSIQGRRQHMEDTYQAELNIGGDPGNAFFGVYDGHGGGRASAYVAQYLHGNLNPSTLHKNTSKALVAAFKKTDEDFLSLAAEQGWDDGTTAVCGVILNRHLVVANCGDSRCIIVQASGRALAMSHDHKANRTDERERIEAAGGRVIHLGTWRVEGILAVARAFGDRHLKKYVPSDPEIMDRKLTSDDLYLVLASDGVWDVMSNQDVADIVLEARTAADAADAVTQAASNRGSMDNITSLVVDLKTFRTAR